MNSIWNQRENNFDFLRLALAVLVIYSHSFPLGLSSDAQEPIFRWTNGQMTGGSIAVDLFFIMSGFLITASAERSGSVFSFLKKRVLRIYPAFVVASLLSAVVVVPMAAAHFAYNSPIARVGDFLLQTLRLVEFHYNSAFLTNPYPGAINGSTWSVSFEFWCYIGVALLLVSTLLRRRILLLAAFLTSVLVSVLFQLKGWIFGGKLLGLILGSPQLWARLLPLYLAGVVFYLFRDRIRLSHTLAIVSGLALVAACWTPIGWTALFPFAGTYLVFYLAFTPWLRLHRFGRFGDFSYGTYLYAFPITQLLMKHFAHPIAPWLLFVCATPLTLIAAATSWYGVERHFLQPARRKETIAHAIDS
ncbi:acyltransferase family protein [Granulicella tundricola]|uniref:Acyltransferase 3 n=1 Tax=Granulicella tundricola (strain ATCC BAA-1859 / DSM 23138 / MP5ACTX9) TaxID=1198114 RepID=E8X012_GRATM|nr:acyltransferase [Granulicella tundricola]ADW68908.1 acyltransferase 3 [Granulicella tundricola MP5ACTX9]